MIVVWRGNKATFICIPLRNPFHPTRKFSEVSLFVFNIPLIIKATPYID